MRKSELNWSGNAVIDDNNQQMEYEGFLRKLQIFVFATIDLLESRYDDGTLCITLDLILRKQQVSWKLEYSTSLTNCLLRCWFYCDHVLVP